jgi:hypothetical protein
MISEPINRLLNRTMIILPGFIGRLYSKIVSHKLFCRSKLALERISFFKIARFPNKNRHGIIPCRAAEGGFMLELYIFSIKWGKGFLEKWSHHFSKTPPFLFEKIWNYLESVKVKVSWTNC